MIVSFFALGSLLLVILTIVVMVILIAQSNNAGVVVALTLIGAVVSLIALSLGWFIAVPVQRKSVRQPPQLQVLPQPVTPPTVADPVESAALPPVAPQAPVAPAPPANPLGQETPAEMMALGPAPILSGTPWDRVVEDTLQANVYSSATHAARALARECLVEWNSQLAETPAAIRIVVRPPHINALGTEVATIFREAFPLADVEPVIEQEPPAENTDLAVIVVVAPVITETRTTLPQQVRGTVRLHGTCQGHTFDGMKRFLEKAWVHQFDEFVSSHPQRSFLRADCRSFANDEASAYNDAVGVAVDALLPRVITLLSDRPYSVVAEDLLRQRLRASIEDNTFVVDRFSQQLTGRSGNVWRATLLIEAQPPRLAAIADVGRVASQERQFTRRAAELSVLLMVGLVLVLYFVVNELTKGYFVWNLRAVTMLALLTMVVAFCWIIR